MIEWMTADDHWWLGWREGFGTAMLVLVIPIVMCYLAMTIVFFRKGETAVGVLCAAFIVLLPMMWFGVLIALLFGWRNASRWQIKAFMALWSGLVLMVIMHFATVIVSREFDGEAMRPILSGRR